MTLPRVSSFHAISLRPRYGCGAARLLCLSWCALAPGLGASADAQAPSLSSPYPREFRAAPLQDVRDERWSPEATPAHVDIADGDVRIERDGVSDVADSGVALVSGDRVSTTRGRSRLLLDHGAAISMDDATTIELLLDWRLRLHQGTVHIALRPGASEMHDLVVYSGVALVRLRSAGEYVISVGVDRLARETVRVHTFRGSAELDSAGRRTLVRAGTDAIAADGLAPSLPHVASGDLGAFGRWLALQPDVDAVTATAGHLPAEIRRYGSTLDAHGAWHYERPHGYVWYPRVDSTWQPYRDGRWSSAGGSEWIWTGTDRWSWPTHHYGRWGLNGGRWFWIPGQKWSPAWVSWVSAPGYVGWCPLGPDNRPVIALSAATVQSGRWNGWTIVPSHALSNGVRVREHAVVRLPSVDRFVPGRPASISQWTREPIRTPAPARVIAPRVRDSATTERAPAPRRGEPAQTPHSEGAGASSGTPQRPSARIAPTREPAASTPARGREPARARASDREPPADNAPSAGRTPVDASSPPPRRARPRAE